MSIRGGLRYHGNVCPLSLFDSPSDRVGAKIYTVPPFCHIILMSCPYRYCLLGWRMRMLLSCYLSVLQKALLVAFTSVQHAVGKVDGRVSTLMRGISIMPKPPWEKGESLISIILVTMSNEGTQGPFPPCFIRKKRVKLDHQPEVPFELEQGEGEEEWYRCTLCSWKGKRPSTYHHAETAHDGGHASVPGKR